MGGILKDNSLKTYTHRYPKNILNFSNANQKGKVHPTQKPTDLLEYLIKTYTNENELVLDFTMGSGSTGVACMNTGRKFIGIELDNNYFNIAKQRIEEACK
jgi:site-specific DNA-methyltransferase (adenine-specific)